MEEKSLYESNYRTELTITGCGLGPPASSHMVLGRWGDGYRITCKDDFDGKQTDTFCDVSMHEVDRQFDLLRNTTVCAYPVSPLVCDGEYVEVTIHGEGADLTMGWWTNPPAGADALFDFSQWLLQLIKSDWYHDPSEDTDDE